jgi:hypothetical protein
MLVGLLAGFWPLSADCQIIRSGGSNTTVRAMLAGYKRVTGFELVVDPRVTNVTLRITFEVEANGKAEYRKLMEKVLLEQAGIVITQLDDKRVSVTHNDALPITPSKKATDALPTTPSEIVASLVGTYSVKENGQLNEFIRIEKTGERYLMSEKQNDRWQAPVEITSVSKADLEKMLNEPVTVNFSGLGNKDSAIILVPKGWRSGDFECKTGIWLATMLGPIELHKQ